MIKKEQGVLTALSKGINGLQKDDSVSGMRFVADVEERVNARLHQKDNKEDFER